MDRPTRLCAALAVLLSLWPGGRILAEPLLPGVRDLTGARALGMGGAFRAVGTGNETIVLNPAGMSVLPRYQLEGQGLLDNAYGHRVFGVSVLDSQTSPVAAGVSYSYFTSGRDEARRSGTLIDLAMSMPVVPDFLYLGVGTKYLKLDGAVANNGVTANVGAMVKLGDLLQLGVVGYNLIDVNSKEAPRQLALGASVGNDQSYRLAIDYLFDYQSQDQTRHALHLGGELFLAQMFTLRAGYVSDDVAERKALAGGLGFVVPGLGLDFAYEHELGGRGQVFTLALKMQML